jgi:hypothetical protein
MKLSLVSHSCSGDGFQASMDFPLSLQMTGTGGFFHSATPEPLLTQWGSGMGLKSGVKE